jgi:hypothetical protein
MNRFPKIQVNRLMVSGMVIVGAWILFEIFNFATTEYALNDVLGDLKFLGMKWSTLLTLAFCAIDFAGIARLFTPEQGRDEPAEVWYLFGAWVLAAAMNATLTWWAVSVALSTHTPVGARVVGQETINNVVPVFVAIMVWVIRILIIATFSMIGDKFFTAQPGSYYAPSVRVHRPGQQPSLGTSRQALPPAGNRQTMQSQQTKSRPEPTYHPAPQPKKQQNDLPPNYDESGNWMM